jgi:GH25 family lysozyme M1 (1,4-beta-N-acetylmuramidase)
MGSNGVDLSEFQAGTSLAALTGLDFVIAKASEGDTIADPTYNLWASQAEEAGAQFGAYHFFHPETFNARAQAEFFVSVANPRSGLSLWVDYETYTPEGGQVDAEEIGLFISTVKIAVPQAKVGIYANGTGLGKILPFLREIPFNGFWYANPSTPMTQQSAGLSWQIHQYESLDGIDRDYSTWSPAQFASYWKW